MIDNIFSLMPQIDPLGMQGIQNGNEAFEQNDLEKMKSKFQGVLAKQMNDAQFNPDFGNITINPNINQTSNIPINTGMFQNVLNAPKEMNAQAKAKAFEGAPVNEVNMKTHFVPPASMLEPKLNDPAMSLIKPVTSNDAELVKDKEDAGFKKLAQSEEAMLTPIIDGIDEAAKDNKIKQNAENNSKVAVQDSPTKLTKEVVKDNDGIMSKDGKYMTKIVAKNAFGNQVPAESFVKGKVSGVDFSDGKAFLMVGSIKVEPEQIIKVFAATGNDVPNNSMQNLMGQMLLEKPKVENPEKK